MLLLQETNPMQYKGELIYIGYKYPEKVSHKRVNVQFDEKFYYCNTCKKLIEANNAPENRGYDLNNMQYIISCPHCGASKYYKDVLDIKRRYVVFNKLFLDDNKLKIKSKQYIFNLNKHNIVYKTEYLRQIVFNLDTGHAYELPIKINNKPYGKIKNITYSIDYRSEYMIDSKYTLKCEDIKDILKEAYEIIRQYKMKKLNCYIPTLLEAAKYAYLQDPDRNCNFFDLFIDQYNNYYYNYYGSLRYKDGAYFSGNDFKKPINEPNTKKKIQLYPVFKENNIDLRIAILAAFNRFPTINCFTAYNHSCVQSSYYHDFSHGFNGKNILAYKEFRRRIKCDSHNPIKEAIESYNVKYIKSLKKLKAKSFNIYYLYTVLAKLKMKESNIVKLLNAINNCSVNDIQYVACAYKIFTKFENYNENSFVNKIVKCVEDNYRHHILADTFKMAGLIISDDKNYSIDLKKRSIKEIHDILSSDYKKLKHKNKIIKYTKKEVDINGFSSHGLKFNLAVDTHELIDVGTRMNICVGSYGDNAINKHCYIVVARDKMNNPIICIEVDNKFKRLRQVKLKYNKRAVIDSDELKAVLEWCITYGFIPDCYDIDNAALKNFFTENESMYPCEVVNRYKAIKVKKEEVVVEEVVVEEVVVATNPPILPPIRQPEHVVAHNEAVNEAAITEEEKFPF